MRIRFTFFGNVLPSIFSDKLPQTSETTTPSWVKEIEKKKNSFNREDVKPEATRVEPKPVTPTASKPVSVKAVDPNLTSDRTWDLFPDANRIQAMTSIFQKKNNANRIDTSQKIKMRCEIFDFPEVKIESMRKIKKNRIRIAFA